MKEKRRSTPRCLRKGRSSDVPRLRAALRQLTALCSTIDHVVIRVNTGKKVKAGDLQPDKDTQFTEGGIKRSRSIIVSIQYLNPCEREGQTFACI